MNEKVDTSSWGNFFREIMISFTWLTVSTGENRPCRFINKTHNPAEDACFAKIEELDRDCGVLVHRQRLGNVVCVHDTHCLT